MDYIIIGGGITGLTIMECLRLRGHNVITYTPDIGGQVKENNIMVGPRILHNSESVRVFLKLIGLDVVPGFFEVGYIHKGDVVNNRFTIEEANNYYYKTRGNSFETNESFMSGQESSIYGYDWYKINLLDHLYKRNKKYIVNTRVDQGLFDYCQSLPAKKISTISFQQLNKFFGNETNLEFGTIHFAAYKKEHHDYDKYSYVYDVRRDSPIKRITSVYDTFHVVEYIEGTSMEYIESTHPIAISSNKWQIKKELKIKQLNNIVLEGRYAQVDHGYKLNNAIEKYLEGKNEEDCSF